MTVLMCFSCLTCWWLCSAKGHDSADVFQLSHLSPLHGMLYMNLKCVMEASVEEKGFLVRFVQQWTEGKASMVMELFD